MAEIEAERLDPNPTRQSEHLLVHHLERHERDRSEFRQFPARYRFRRSLQRPERQWQPRPRRAWLAGLYSQSPETVRCNRCHDDERCQRQLSLLERGARQLHGGRGFAEWMDPNAASQPSSYSFSTESGTRTRPVSTSAISRKRDLTGTVYNDLTGDGTQTSNDPLLEGWTLDLLDSSGGLLATTTSNSSGDYDFNGLSAGDYTVQEVVQPGWYITQPTNPPGTYTISAAKGSSHSGLNFGNFKLITASGSIYNDLDGNGLRRFSRARFIRVDCGLGG